MTQLYANLRKDSKYYEGQVQNQPFPVSFDADVCGYHWNGGIGGQYRTTDLHFFVEMRGEFKEINMAYLGQLPQLEVTKNRLVPIPTPATGSERQRSPRSCRGWPRKNIRCSWKKRSENERKKERVGVTE